MAGETIVQLGAQDLRKNSALGYNPAASRAPWAITESTRRRSQRTPTPVTTSSSRPRPGPPLTTGFKVDLVLVDDGKDANDLGKVAVFGVLMKKLASGTDTLDMTFSVGGEITANATLAATAGVITTLTVSVPNASADSVAAGDTFMMRIRRVGTNAADTCSGRILCVAATVYAY